MEKTVVLLAPQCGDAVTSVHRQLLTAAGRKKVAFLREIIEKLGRPRARPLRVLDYGCGDGFVAALLGEMGCAVDAVDPDEAALAQAKTSYAASRVQFMTTEEWGHDQCCAAYDVIVCFEVLQYIENVEALFKQFASMLSRDGTLVLSAPNATGPYCILRRLAWWVRRSPLRLLVGPKLKVSRPSPPRPSAALKYHLGSLRLRRIRRALCEAGLRVVRFGHSDFVWGPLFCAGLSGLVNPHTSLFGRLDRLDGWCADILPSALVSGWFVECAVAEQQLAEPGG